MGKIVETKIDSWGGGIKNDPRDPKENTCQVVTNFDLITNPRKLTQYRDSESGDSSPTTSQKQNFCIGYWTATPSWRLFSLGVKSGAGTAEILMKGLTTSSSDLSDSGWSTPANNQSSSGATNFNLFTYYHQTGKIYGARANRYIWEFTPDGSTAWADSKYDYGSTFTNLTDGIIHSKDDIMYFGIDNEIIKNNNGTFSKPLTLPTHLKITSLSEYGNFLAIACSPLSGLGNSIVYLWDRDSSLTTLSESIDFGEGELKIIEQVDGILMGISISGNSTTRFGDRVIFRYYAGGAEAVQFQELISDSSGITLLPIAKQKIDNRLYFMLSAYINGAQRDGVWSVGREGGDFAIAHERTPNNDTALSSPILYNFIFVGDYLFQSYNSGGSFALSKTNNTASYTASGIYESKRFDAGDASLKKKLVGATVSTEYLPTAGQVILEYRTDQNTAWTTIFTEGTDNSISHSAINIESTGASLPQDYKEIEFKIEATGGAEITALSFQEEIVGKRLYG